jgi:hypothetical protein
VEEKEVEVKEAGMVEAREVEVKEAGMEEEDWAGAMVVVVTEAGKEAAGKVAVATVALGVEREAVEKVVAMGVGMVHAVCLAGMSSRSIDS